MQARALVKGHPARRRAIPISNEVSEGLGELAFDVEETCLLALFPSNKVAAFCVRLAAMSEDAAAQRAVIKRAQRARIGQATC